MEIPSISELSWVDRLPRLEAVKKLTGLSRAVLTRRPVARLFCVRAINSAVFCRARRMLRAAYVSVMPDT